MELLNRIKERRELKKNIKQNTKKDVLIDKYLDLKDAILEQGFAHKFHQLLPSLDQTSITDVILFIQQEFLGKDSLQVLKLLLQTNNIDLEEDQVKELQIYMDEFIGFLELLNVF
jgi:hypothetical protein